MFVYRIYVTMLCICVSLYFKEIYSPFSFGKIRVHSWPNNFSLNFSRLFLFCFFFFFFFWVFYLNLFLKKYHFKHINLEQMLLNLIGGYYHYSSKLLPLFIVYSNMTLPLSSHILTVSK